MSDKDASSIPPHTHIVVPRQSHEISTTDKCEASRERLKDYSEKLDTDVRPKVAEMEDQVKEDEKEDESTVNKVINDINEFRTKFIQEFHVSCDKLISDVKKYPCRNTEGLREIEKSKNTMNEIKEKIEKGKLDIIEYEPPKLESLIPTIKRNDKVEISFEPSMRISEVMNESVGKIEPKRIDRGRMHRFTMSRSEHVRKVHSFKSKIVVTSLTTAGNNTAWVVYCKSPTMYLYNDKGDEVKCKTVRGSGGINDISITPSGEIIVSCVDKKVKKLVGDKISPMIDTESFDCNGVCVTDKQEIAVCMSGQGDKNHVAVYSSDGRNLREIRGRDGQGKHLITDPSRVVQNGQDLCVVNGGNVVCVDEGDNVRWVYDGKQAKLEESFYPLGICVDTHKKLLVSEGKNHCVHYIDSEGGLIQVILTDEQTRLSSPWGICVDNATGHVWVGNIHKDVVITKYLKQIRKD